MTLLDYLAALNSKSPTPGGGAVAGTTGATGAAIAGMVLQYTLGKKKFAEHEASNSEQLQWITDAQSKFITLADDDACGYGRLNALWSLPESDPARVEGWDAAVQSAIDPPNQMLELSHSLMRRLKDLLDTTNTQLHSDLAVAATTTRAAAHNAACNIRINVPLLPEDQRQPTLDHTQSLLDAIDELCKHTERACR